MQKTMRNLTSEEMEELRRLFPDLDVEMSDKPFDPFSWRESAGDTCLHIAVLRNDLRSVELLIKGGIDIDAKGDMGCTALHNATAKGLKDIYTYLIGHGASTEIHNDFGKTPLDALDRPQG